MTLNIASPLSSGATGVPEKIREGVFGAAFSKNGETLFVRMERLTEASVPYWDRFRGHTSKIANDQKGALSLLTQSAGGPRHPSHAVTQRATGFTPEEYTAFTQEAIALKATTQGKALAILLDIAAGSDEMWCLPGSYVIYVTKNPNFAIPEVPPVFFSFSIKKYCDTYQDILIATATHFHPGYFHTRGIFRNPHWVFKNQYSGLSMIVHGFSGAVMEKFFPEKREMRVQPIDSMHRILQRHLLPEEICILHTETTDLPDEQPKEVPLAIKTDALCRIYFKLLSELARSS